MNEDIDYLETVGLKSYLDEFITQSDPSQSIMYNESDIHFIHDLVRKRRSFTTLEFGVGFSTIAIAHALKLNKEDLISSGKELKVRNSNLFRHFVVDSNEFWLKVTSI